MTSIMDRSKLYAILGSVLLTASTGSQAVLPKGDYACQVQTAGGQSGLVLVQTDSRAEARKVAGSSMAAQMDGAQSKAISVVECIQTPGEKFKDSWFNKFYEDFPL